METVTLLDLPPSPGVLTGSEVLETVVSDTSVSITTQQVSELSLAASAIDAQERVDTLAATVGMGLAEKVDSSELASPNGSTLVGHTDGGLPTTVGDRLSTTPDVSYIMRQAKMFEPVFGFDNGTIDTSIYPGARNATQGMTVVEYGGQTLLVITQRVSGSSWETTERCRIITIPMREDGLQYADFTYSTPINIAHGYDIGARIEGGDLYIYSSQTVLPGLTGTNGGKGYSKTKWRGALTDQTDVASFTLWGQEGSGHPYQTYNRAGVTVSDDGVYICMVSAPVGGQAGRTVFVYDRAEVEALSDKLTAEPVSKFDFTTVLGQGANVTQGICCDGHEISMVHGGTDTFGSRYILTYTVDGRFISNVQFDGAVAEYGLDGLLDSPYGTPWRFEPEGVCNYRGGKLIMSNEGWYASAPIVTYLGANWGGILPSSTVGTPPSNGAYFVRSKKAATDGAWVNTGNYPNTSNFNRELKKVYYVGKSLGLVQEVPNLNGIADRTNISAVNTGQGGGAYSMGMQWRGTLTIVGEAERLATAFNALTYDTSSRWRVYDQREGSDNSKFVSAQATFDSSEHTMVLRASGTTAATSPIYKMHADTCPSGFAHWIREFTGASGSVRRETTQNGETRFTGSSGFIPLTADRPESGMTLSVKRAGVVIGGFSQNTAAVKVIAAEGLNVRISNTVSGVEVDGWEQDSGTQGFRPMITDAQNIGISSRRPLAVWGKSFILATGVINTSGTGSPEGVLTANPGSTYVQTNGTSGNTNWKKDTGTGNTGWVVH